MDGGLIRISKNFRNEIIEKIKETEEKRTGTKPSNTETTEILYKRILNAGGIKDM